MRALDITTIRRKALVCLALLIGVVPSYYLLPTTHASNFPNRSLSITSSLPGVTADYNLKLTLSDPASIGSLELVFCTNSPLFGDTCTVPTGLDLSNVTLTSQTGLNDFTLTDKTANRLLLSRTPSAIAAPQDVSFTFSGLINPSNAGSYYGRLATYATSDGSGPVVDFAGTAFAVLPSLQISTKVPPYLTFCSGVSIANFDCSQATGDYLNLGELSSKRTSAASSQMVAATNAADGYIVQVTGTTLTAGNNIIKALSNSDVSRPGTAQFGINLRSNTTPAVGSDPTGLGTGLPAAPYGSPDQYRFQSDDPIVQTPHSDDYREYTVSYIINIPINQPAGVYASTLTYICTPSF